ncbi:MAG: methyltransferase, partial [Nanoarchaeota archaeon]
IKWSRLDMEWADTKHDKESVDRIITQPPLTNQHSAKEIAKAYDELFYQSAFILRKGGRIAMLVQSHHDVSAAVTKHGFDVTQKIPLMTGREHRTLLLIERQGI